LDRRFVAEAAAEGDRREVELRGREAGQVGQLLEELRQRAVAQCVGELRHLPERQRGTATANQRRITLFSDHWVLTRSRRFRQTAGANPRSASVRRKGSPASHCN